MDVTFFFLKELIINALDQIICHNWPSEFWGNVMPPSPTGRKLYGSMKL